MINARLKEFKIDIPSFAKGVDMFVCENYLKTTYLIVIPSLNWGYKLSIETSYDDMKKNMIDSLRKYNFLPSSEEEVVMEIFYIIFGEESFKDPEEKSTNEV